MPFPLCVARRPFARGSDRRIIGHDGYAERYGAKGRTGKGAFKNFFLNTAYTCLSPLSPSKIQGLIFVTFSCHLQDTPVIFVTFRFHD